jgi:CheY-like chemotaxis protein
VAGLATSFGSGAMTNSIDDLEKAQAFLVIGSNTTENHPIIGDRLKKAIVRQGVKLVVIDPRKIELTRYANVVLQASPGFNIPIVNALMHVILKEGLHDEPHIRERCEGFEEFAASLEDFSPEKVEALTGISAGSLREAARIYATSKPASILYCMGVTQHSQGTDAVRALANLAMLCGNVGKEGGGLNPLRGQNNVQGACDMGSFPHELTGYRHISGDANRLQQVVWNLLSNAIKFTQARGRVNVSLKLKESNVQLSVSDTGRGIDPDFLPFVFDRFRQADTGTARHFGGLGLGLSIVRHLVELHGGTVEAHSEGEERGATFTITLPNSVPPSCEPDAVCGKTSSRWTEAPEKDIPPASIAGQHILLVDNNEGMLRLLAEVLRECGAIVEVAQSAKEAIEVLERFQADVIVSDLAMPEDDGYSLIQTIRARENGERKLAQAIALTALVRVEDRARAISAGFNMFLPKPIQLDELISAIGKLTVSG